MVNFKCIHIYAQPKIHRKKGKMEETVALGEGNTGNYCLVAT